MTDRWHVPGTLGIGTAFDEPTDSQTALSLGWTGVGSAIRHSGWETLNLLDGRAAAVGQGANLNWWGLNAGTPPKTVRLGAISSRFAATADGKSAGYMSFFTKPATGDVIEALRITEAGNVGIGTTTPGQRLEVNGGAVVRGVAIAADVPGIDYPYEYESIGVANKTFNLRLQSPNSVLVHTAGLPRLWIDQAGNVNVIGPTTLTVGQGSNGSLKVRHIDGKSHVNDNHDALYLNWGTAKWVVIARPESPSGLQVHGDLEVKKYPAADNVPDLSRLSLTNRGPGGAAVTWTLQAAAVGGGWGVHPNGVELWEYPATQPRLQIRPGGETVLVPQGQRLHIGGEIFARAIRTNIVGFDGGGRTGGGYHWVRTDADERELWYAYAQRWPNRTDIPRRVEFAVPVWAPVIKQTSDARLKRDVRGLGDVLDKLSSIRGVSFRLTTPEGEELASRDIGVIAQELETAFPDLVSGDGEAHYKTVNYSGLVGVLVEAVKALDARSRALEQQVLALGRSA
jgi:hypothetical protein